LALNTLWSVLFFGMHTPGVSLVEIVLLWVAIATTLAMFWRIDRVAGALLVPYLAWVSFATYLNVAIWWLNQ
jgi:tryptophan-rich sensory protein